MRASNVELQSQLEQDLQTRDECANFTEAACGHHLVVFIQSCIVVSGLYVCVEGWVGGEEGGGDR